MITQFVNHSSIFVIGFVLSFAVSYAITRIIERYSLMNRIFDIPNLPRKIHKKPIPLMGGTAIYASFAIVSLIFLFGDTFLTHGYFKEKYMYGILIGGLVLIIGGALDDKYRLPPFSQFFFTVLASFLVPCVGIGADVLFQGVIRLDRIKIPLFTLSGDIYYLTLFADIFTIFWVLGMIYTTKKLDGLDGLSSGVTLIGTITLFFLSLSLEIQQPETALISIIFAGAIGGFLIRNFYPAKIFLGEGGSTYLGYVLGILAIISGAKVATAFLVMGMPIFDVAFVILQRLIKKKSIFKGDKLHMHFKLLELGFSDRSTVLLYYFISASFGILALQSQLFDKLYLLGFLLLIFIVFFSAYFLKFGFRSLNREK